MNIKLVSGTVAAFVMTALALCAQSYSVDWYGVDGGGGTSTGGVYAVAGTIGQPDAGHMSGGSYSLEGGFWGIIAAMQTPGAPLLSVSLSPTNTVLVSWPYPSTGFSLQQNGAVNTANWTGVTNSAVQVGQQWQVIVPRVNSNRFYRLLK